MSAQAQNLGDLDAEGVRPRAREWLTDVSMGYFPGALKAEQPVNGVRFAAKTNALCARMSVMDG
jgi:hypothetical protein